MCVLLRVADIFTARAHTAARGGAPTVCKDGTGTLDAEIMSLAIY